MRRSRQWVAILGLTGVLAGAAHADESTGIYAGFSLGQSRTDFSDDVLDEVFDGEDTAFKILGGYRILEWFGVEVAYVDLGEITTQANVPGLTRFRLEESGFTASAVFLWTFANADLFAKGGLIASQSHLRVNSNFGTFFPAIVDTTENNTDLAWGVGGQVRFGKLGVRLEYERFDIDLGSDFDAPGLITLGATWTFF